MFEGCSPERAGRSPEAVGNGSPRWMVANRGNARNSGEQNPAYEPARPHLTLDLLRAARLPSRSRFGGPLGWASARVQWCLPVVGGRHLSALVGDLRHVCPGVAWHAHHVSGYVADADRCSRRWCGCRAPIATRRGPGREPHRSTRDGWPVSRHLGSGPTGHRCHHAAPVATAMADATSAARSLGLEPCSTRIRE